MVRVTAKADYAVRVLLALAAQPPDALTTADRLAEAQGWPVKFIQNILVELRARDLVRNTRGHGGGYRLARPPEQITVLEVVAIVEGFPPPADPTSHLDQVWSAASASMRALLEQVTLGDIIAGRVPGTADFH